MVDHLAERTAFHVQLQVAILSLNVLQSQCIFLSDETQGSQPVTA